jgi:hypothetical protein
MSTENVTDIAELLGQLNGGVFEQQVNRALSDAAANVCTHNEGRGKPKKGKVVLEFTIEQIGESHQVTLTHAIKATIPKPRGRMIEEHTTETPLHVGKGGKLTLFPNTQTGLELGAGAATGRTDGVRSHG